MSTKEEEKKDSFHERLRDVTSDVEKDLLCLERRYFEGFERTRSLEFEFDFVWTDEIEVLRGMKKLRIKMELSEEFPINVPMIHVLEGPKDAAKRIETALRMKAAAYSAKKSKKSYLRKLFKWLDKNMLRIFNNDKKEKDFEDDKKETEKNEFEKSWGKEEHVAFEKSIRKFVMPKLRSRRYYSQRERKSWWYKVSETIGTKRSPEECLFHYRDMRLKMLESRLRSRDNDMTLKKSIERAREALHLIRSVLDRKLQKKTELSTKVKETEIPVQVKVNKVKVEEKEEKEENRSIENTTTTTKFSAKSDEFVPTMTTKLSAESDEYVPPLTTKHYGTQISLSNVELKAVSLVQCTRLGVQARCKRCRKDNAISLQNQKEEGFACSQCRGVVILRFRSEAVHSNNNTLGYVDLIDNCSGVHSMYLSDFHVTCANCGELEKIRDVRPVGDVCIRFCKKCHTKMEFNSRRVAFMRTTTSSSNSSTSTTKLNVKVEGRSKKSRRAMDAALGIRVGSALPKMGACKHYRKSTRWFRFPCCGKAYPCDKCHEEGEKKKCPLDARANREICGYCANEQPISGAKMSKCRRCDKIISGAPKTRHWEGGKGCRDTSKMSRKDRAKYRNSKNKTSSVAKTKKKK